MTQLHICLLGQPRILLNAQPVASVYYNKVQALLFYLVTEAAQPHPRRVLAGLLWPDMPAQQALHNLRQALLTLRRSLPVPAGGEPFLTITRQYVQWNRASTYTLDVEQFLALVQASPHLTAAQGKAAMALYQGDFLHQFVLDGNEAFEEWVTLWREQLHIQMMDLLYALWSRAEQQGEQTDAVAFARHALRLEPWNEEAHRTLMRIYAARSQRSAALAQYNTCVEVLQRELGLEPSQPTRLLYTQIKAATAQRPSGTRRMVGLLPSPAGALLGRDVEVSEVCALMQQSACRMLTLVGGGGTGKTRLAIEAAHRLMGSYRDAVSFADLSAITTAEQLIEAIADAIGVRRNDTDDVESAVIDFLREKELLLLLDNFEHLISATPLLHTLLQQAPEVCLLITSREPLQSRWEWRYPLSGLAYPDDLAAPDVQDYAAIQLFLQRLRQVRPSPHLDAAELGAIATICGLVEGIPLAIELAAALGASQSCTEIAALLTKSADTLAADLRDLPSRQRSMRAVFEYSWGLLDADARQSLGKLTLFRASFTSAAAFAVADAAPALLTALVNKSLIQWQPTSRRYTMHQLMRQYAHEKLAADAQQVSATRLRHCRYIATMLAEAAPYLRGTYQRNLLHELVLQIEDIRAAWQYALDTDAFEQMDLMLPALFSLYRLRGWYREGADNFAKGIERIDAMNLADQPTAWLRLRLLIRRAWFVAWLAEYERAEADLLTAHRLLESHAHLELGLVTYGLSAIAYFRGDFAASEAWGHHSLHHYRQAADQIGIAQAMANLAGTYVHRGNYAVALDLYQQTLDLYRQLDDRAGQADVWNGIGITTEMLGDYQRARLAMEQSLQLSREIFDLWDEVRALGNLGNLARRTGDLHAARTYCEQSLELSRELGDRYGIAFALNTLGDIARLQGDVAAAYRQQQHSYAISEELGDIAGMGFALCGLAELALAQHDYAAAHAAVQQALRLFGDGDNLWGLTLAYCLLGELHHQQGQHREALATLHTALEHASTSESVPLLTRVLVVWAEVLAQLDCLKLALWIAAVARLQQGLEHDVWQRIAWVQRRADQRLPEASVLEQHAQGMATSLDTVTCYLLATDVLAMLPATGDRR